jgi:aspartate/methionine/tyrosine aminotransferase
MAAPSGGVRRSYASAGALATRRELLERRLVDAVRGHDDRPHRRRREHRRLALAALQECHLAQQRARAELGDLLPVDLDVDDAVQDQEEVSILTEDRVVLAPGEGFGPSGAGYARRSLAVSDETRSR